MNSNQNTGPHRRSSITQWLFGPNGMHNDPKGSGNSQILNGTAVDNTVLSEDQILASEDPKRTRSGSMTERLGLHKVPTHDHEAIIRGDFHH